MSSQWTMRIVFGLFIAFLFFWFLPNESTPRPVHWDIKLSSGKLSIMGLNLNTSSLKDANAILNSQPETAFFTTRQREGEPVPPMHLESYYKDLFNEGDNIIIGLHADAELLQKIKDRAYQPTLFPNDTIRTSITDEMMEFIPELTIRSITIVAGEKIDTKEFDEKFGKPSQMIDDGTGNAHFLHPELGLDFIQPSEGRQVLQFVSPERFEAELLIPLMKSKIEGYHK